MTSTMVAGLNSCSGTFLIRYWLIRIGQMSVFHVKWGTHHYSMVLPQVVDRGNSLKIWSVAANKYTE
jgi:hypothetical protein